MPATVVGPSDEAGAHANALRYSFPVRTSGTVGSSTAGRVTRCSSDRSRSPRRVRSAAAWRASHCCCRSRISCGLDSGSFVQPAAKGRRLDPQPIAMVGQCFGGSAGAMPSGAGHAVHPGHCSGQAPSSVRAARRPAGALALALAAGGARRRHEQELNKWPFSWIATVEKHSNTYTKSRACILYAILNFKSLYITLQ